MAIEGVKAGGLKFLINFLLVDKDPKTQNKASWEA
jgi:hypothetical protein